MCVSVRFMHLKDTQHHDSSWTWMWCTLLVYDCYCWLRHFSVLCALCVYMCAAMVIESNRMCAIFSSSFVCWVRASVHSNVSRCWQMKYRLINKPDNGMIWFVRIGMCTGMQEIYSLFLSCERNKFNFGPLGKFILRKKLETIHKSGIKCIRMRRGGL